MFRIRQSLSDNHVLFDVIVEPRFTADGLASFEVVIVPYVTHMNSAERDALTEYVAGGGRLVVIGDSGARDEYGDAHAASLRELLADHDDSVLWADSVDELVPKREPELFDLTEEESNTFETLLALPDRVGSPAEAHAARNAPLTPALEALVGRSLAILGDDAPYTVRASMFRDNGSGRLVVHLVNYDLPVIENGRGGIPIPAQDISVTVPAQSATVWTPHTANIANGEENDDDGESRQLAADAGGFVVPEVRVYAMIEVAPPTG